MQSKIYAGSLTTKTVLTFIIALLTLTATSVAKAEIYLSKVGTGLLLGADGVAVDSAGNIYVAEGGNRRVRKFAPNGNASSFITDIDPEDLAIDSNGNLYVTDPINRHVRKYSPTGSLLEQIEPVCTPGIGSCLDPDGPGPRPTVYRPDSVAVDRWGNIFIVGVFHLQRYTPSGSLDQEFELGGIVPTSVAVDNDGNIFIFEKDNGRINKYNAAGELLEQFGRSGCDLSTRFNCEDPDGGGPLEIGDGQFGIGGPEDLAIDPWGNIYGTDPRNGRVMKFSNSGQFLLKFGSPGTGDGQFGDAQSGVTVDASGKIYITDSNDRVQIFDQGDTRSVSSATGAGVVMLTTNFGMFNSASAVAESSLPTGGKPANVAFPYGFFSWTVMGLIPGQSITMTLKHPAAIATGAQYWKVPGGTWTNATSSLTSDDGDNVIVITITDGGPGDGDGVVNGRISDLAGLAALVSSPAEVPFSDFQADMRIRRGPKANDDDFQLTATFALGAASNGIDPVTEVVVLEFGGLTITIPAGSFRADQRGRFRFDGTVGGIDIRARIDPLGGNRYDVRLDGDGADLTTVVSPVTVRLTIGNDAGEVSVAPRLNKATPHIFP